MLAKASNGPKLDDQVRTAERMQDEESPVKASIVAKVGAFVVAGTCLLCAGAVSAQTPAPAQTTASTDQAATSSEPLKLQLPNQDSQPWPQAGGQDSPGEYYGDNGKDENDQGVEVHGSVTTGIGYSKGYGTSQMNAIELHISKPYGDGKTFDMHINAEHTKGPGFSPYRYPYGGYYGPRYP